MKYYSTNRQSPMVDFKEATLRGQAPDRGLYFPESIPVLDKACLKELKKIPREELGYQIMHPYVGNTISADALRNIISETLSFDFPLVQLEENIYVLELFHGPTLAFKDVGARFMSRCLGYFSNYKNSKTTVLVATSGDTGGAVANGFLNVDGVEVIILYPAGKVSKVQELQLTTCGNNVTALRIHGSFDDCQQIVKEAFMDEALNKILQLTSANSINIARWLPQQLYYFFALQQWNESVTPVMSVPSGNLGNIAAGLLAKRSGLEIAYFIAACNVNDTVSGFLSTGIHSPKKTQATISNAMDVGNPSNLIRIIEMYQGNGSLLSSDLRSSMQTDDATIEAIRSVYEQYKYILDPHAAVGYNALKNELRKGEKGIFLATAHPVKFPETVEKIIEKTLPIPASIESLFDASKNMIDMKASYQDFKEWMRYRSV